MPIIKGDDSRRLVPQAIVSVLTELIGDALHAGDPAAELRSIRSRLCRVFGIPDPMQRANDSDVAQAIAEEDGDGHEDTL